MNFCGVFGCMSTPVWGPNMFVYKQTSFKKGPYYAYFLTAMCLVSSWENLAEKSLSELSSDLNFCYSNIKCLCSILDCSLLGLCMRKKGPKKIKKTFKMYQLVSLCLNSKKIHSNRNQTAFTAPKYTAAKSLKQILHFKESDSKAFRRPRSQVLSD